jgi:hypothetical protein
MGAPAPDPGGRRPRPYRDGGPRPRPRPVPRHLLAAAPPPRRRPAPALLLAAVAVAVAVLVGTWLIVRPSDDPRPVARPASATPGPAASVQAAVAWTTANLPVGTRVLAPVDVVRLLDRAAFRGFTSSGATCPTDGFIVATAALRDRARREAAVAGCLAGSLPVALFGRGADETEIRQTAADVAAARRIRAKALADRRRGGAALIGNPALSVPAGLRRAVVDGGLDLRAETVLAELARLGPLRLGAVAADPAEVRAGLPARVVEIAVPSPSALRSALAATAADFRPRAATTESGGAMRLTWPFRVSSPPVLD